ncbi:MAG: dTMP kinase [Solirubrobacterales bacterium]
MGLFISLEGIDGSGKTTQAKLLAEELGEETVLVREPGGTTASEAIRNLLTNPEVPLNWMPEVMLFCAARAQLVEDVIAPALEAGRDVVCDRFSDSSVAYQGAGREHDMRTVRLLCEGATQNLWPDLTLLLWVDPERAFKRAKGRDRFETEGLAFQQRVAAGYEAIAAAEPERVRVVDASGSIDEVHGRVMSVVEEAQARA